MKKVFGLLLILVSLSLLDGTPVHNHHGRFISTRNKTSLHVAYTNSDSFSFSGFDQDIDDDDNDDNEIVTTASIGIILSESCSPSAVSYSFFLIADNQQYNVIPLYKLICDFRI